MTFSEAREVIDALERTPQLVESVTKALRDGQLRIRNSAEEFSAVENICHLRDLEIEGYRERIARILNEDRPSLPDIDGPRLAIERNYNRQNAELGLEQFTKARQENIETLRALKETDFVREGTLEGTGTITVERLLEMMLEHDEEHLQELEIIQRRFKGNPKRASGF